MKIGLNILNVNSNVLWGANNKNATRPCLYPNLAPLQKDTVSFSGRSMFVNTQMKDAPRERDCRSVYKNAEPAKIYLESVIEQYIAPYVKENDSSKLFEYPVDSCSIRIKKPSSIREKVASKFPDKYEKDLEDYSNKMFMLLSQNFKKSEAVSSEEAIDSIKNIVEAYSQQRKLSPFKNSGFFIDKVFASLVSEEEGAFFSCAGMEERKINRIKDDILSYFMDIHKRGECQLAQDIPPQTIAGIKHYAQDIVGARVLLRESDPDYTRIVINALKDAVDAGALKITSIENNIPAPEKMPADKSLSDYIYATEPQLLKLASAADAPLLTNLSKSGYLAIHINVDLSNSKLFGNTPYDGYMGEIQIIGKDVEKLKDVEDLCYKCKDNKKAIHTAYKDFLAHFNKYYQGDDVKQAFEDYTYALYLYQKAIPAGSQRRKEFPSLKELGFDKSVPPELDFNVLAKIKKNGDVIREQMDKAEDEKAAKTTPTSAQTRHNRAMKQIEYKITSSFDN